MGIVSLTKQCENLLVSGSVPVQSAFIETSDKEMDP